MSFSELGLLGPGWQIFFAVVVFVLGTCMGSFMNCFAWRIVNGESVLKGRSHCTSCNHALGPLDLVPLLSWLALRGKCRYCGEPVSARYMATELISGLFFLSIFISFGLTLQTLVFLVLGCVLLGLSLVDIDSMLIPNGFVVFGVVLWAVYAALRLAHLIPVDNPGVLAVLLFPDNPALGVVCDELIAAFVIFGVMFLIVVVFGAVRGVAGMGMGDLKLYFMVSLYLGVACSLFNLILSCIVGLIMGVAYNARPATASDTEVAPGDKTERKSKPFPFGPSIALATWIALLIGPQAVNAYLSLLGL